MDPIIESSIIRNQKGELLLDLIEKNYSEYTIKISVIEEDNSPSIRSIEFSHHLLKKMIAKLEINHQILIEAGKLNSNEIEDHKLRNIKNAYLRNVPLSQLSMIYGIDEETIKMHLEESGLYITSETSLRYKKKPWRGNRKNRRG